MSQGPGHSNRSSTALSEKAIVDLKCGIQWSYIFERIEITDACAMDSVLMY